MRDILYLLVCAIAVTSCHSDNNIESVRLEETSEQISFPIGEPLFPSNRYRSNLFYVAPEGLYISESHYRNPSFDEDSLVFRLFRIAERGKITYNPQIANKP